MFRFYTLSCSIMLSVLAFSEDRWPASSSVSHNIHEFFTTPNGVIGLSLFTTYGVHVISSLLFLDPLHVLTSLPQYALLMTSYINILDVYAFCHLHGVYSWWDWDEVQPRRKDPGTWASIDRMDMDPDVGFQNVIKRGLSPYRESSVMPRHSLESKYLFRTYLITFWIFWFLDTTNLR
jgi:chitin synthase